MIASCDGNFNACDDFLNLVLKGHIIAASMEYLSMHHVSDTPNHHMLTDDLWTKQGEIRNDKLMKVSREIVNKFIDVEL